ncbi:sensor histidine kinase [Tenuibacillus multivorans]|uniref:Sensor histidine kinase n=1 Tax=Tenuibacillus multivorans TaxID=237069 RepID=A0A1H0A444_9BACI|nr:sensor histidine kinase [Tenuibacillus multivorans]GEL78381.1 sensor histidine kinase LiaS [Tenuibacillus multivorans]SDN28197.1 two-component system, NarL family, sensor histidine kinase LiaS [Tenuibacillus multivorans]
MIKRLRGIRFQLMRSELYIIYFSLLVIALISFFTYSVLQPNWLSLEAIFFLLAMFVIVMTPVGLYVIFNKTKSIKERINTYSIFVSMLQQGKYSAKLYLEDADDELDTFGEELNDLAKKMKDQVSTLQRLADEKSEFANKAHIAATMEERQRLARDLHDAVSQQLFALTMMSQATVKLIDKNPEKAREQIKEISEMALQAQNEMRALLLHLRPVFLSGEPLNEGIIRLVEELKKKSGMQFHLDIDEGIDLSQSKEEHIFRMVQEALSNILRHANAQHVTLKLKDRDQEIYIHIDDDGVGFKANEKIDQKTSYGLKTMKERCEEIGGTFRIKSQEGQGTYIDIRIPK